MSERDANLRIRGLIDGFRSRTRSPVEVLEGCLARIEAQNPVINAFTRLDLEGARGRARESEARWHRGEPLGPIDGVPFAVKDNLMVAGMPFRRGSCITPDTPAAETAPAAARCLEAGGVLVGLTAMPDFGIGPITISTLTGITRNPWNPSLQAGGSSGGGAAAVAAGFAAFSVTSDAGGSTRIPAALTGTVGYKATGGRVPMYPASSGGALSCNGPLTRSVADAALLMNLMAQPDVRDAQALPHDGVDYVAQLGSGIAGVRIALSTTLGYAKKVHPEFVAAVRAAGRVLEQLGAWVEERDPGVEDPTPQYLMLLLSGVRHALRASTLEQRARLSPEIQEILAAPEPRLEDYLTAVEACQVLARRMNLFHRDFDLLLTPTVAWPAFAAERSYPEAFECFDNRRAWVPFTAIFNLTQQPAISIPAGITSEGLPIGIQLVGPRGVDANVLRAAAAYEAAAPFTHCPPTRNQ